MRFDTSPFLRDYSADCLALRVLKQLGYPSIAEKYCDGDEPLHEGSDEEGDEVVKESGGAV